MRATEHQRVKVKAFAYLEQHHPGDIKNAKEVNRRPLEPPAQLREQLRLVTYFEKGHLKGKYVDPYIANSLENNTNGQNHAVVAALTWVNNWFRRVFTVWNVGFQTFNVRRDFKRFWKNMPAMTRRQAHRALLAGARARGGARLRLGVARSLEDSTGVSHAAGQAGDRAHGERRAGVERPD